MPIDWRDNKETYKGAWDASTNTPTLTDGVGTIGDYYNVSVAGTQDLGSGSIIFTIGDDVKYNGSAWFKIDRAQDIWKRVTGSPNYMAPITVGDETGATGERIAKGWYTNLDVSTAIVINTNTTISESSGDSLRQNSSATNDIIDKLGDAAGATHYKVKDSAGVDLFSIDSADGETSIGEAGVAGLVEVKDGSDTIKIKLSPTSDSYLIGGNLGLGTSTPNTISDIQGGQTVKITTVNAATYDLLVTDYIIHVTYTTTGAVTSLTLPSAQTVSGRIIIIKDAAGNAGTNNITVDTSGSETIDGAATLTIDADYDSVSLYSDGSNWFIY